MAHKSTTDPNPMAINIRKFQRYNFSFLKTEEVIMYEYFIVLAMGFGYKQFYHSTSTIEKETGLKRSKLESIIKKFASLRMLEVELKGFPKVKHFRVNFKIIESLFSLIYKTGENGKLSVENTKLLADFYTPMVEKYQQKNSNKETLKETLKETSVTDTEWILFFENFKEISKKILVEYKLSDYHIKFKTELLYDMYCNYPKEIILEYLIIYYEKNGWGYKISEFLKADSQNKNLFIEERLANEKLEAKSLLKSLDEMYNERREKYSTEEKEYPKTMLVINSKIKTRVIEVLKVKDKQVIKNSFLAYIDAILAEDTDKPNYLLPFFFTQKDGDYVVIDQYLELFNQDYSIS